MVSFSFVTVQKYEQTLMRILKQAQTPQQRRANERYAKAESLKRGKSVEAVAAKIKEKSPISPILLGRGGVLTWRAVRRFLTST